VNRLPCKQPDVDPDDWFIGKDGRQYADDELFPEEEFENVALEARATYREGREDMILRANLRRRRHAKDACFTSCPARLECLAGAFERDEPHGTWGGYYTEERREIEKARFERARRTLRS